MKLLLLQAVPSAVFTLIYPVSTVAAIRVSDTTVKFAATRLKATRVAPVKPLLSGVCGGLGRTKVPAISPLELIAAIVVLSEPGG